MKKQLMYALVSFSFLAHPTLALANEGDKEAFMRSEKAAYLEQVEATLIIDHPEALRGKIGNDDQEEDRESSPSSPPLQTDDTGTPGPGGIELNLLTNCDRGGGSRSCESVIDANYGIGEKIQIKVERGYEVNHMADGSTNKGMSPTEVGVKYRFYDNKKKGFSAAIYPNVTTDNSKMHSSDPDAEQDREGNSVYIPLILSKEFGKYTIVTNTGYRRSSKGREYDSIITSAAIGRVLNEKSRIMGEVYSERDRQMLNRRTDVRVGYIRIVSPKNSEYQTSVFASFGHSINATEDGHRHTTVNIGLSLVKKPKS